MKKLIFIITLFLLFLNCTEAANVKTVTKDYKIVTNDGFSINAILEYPKVNSKKNFETVVLLHSLGYSSEWWEGLPDMLIDNGYAVLKIDLRGHGKSIYNAKLSKTSWKNLTKKAYAKYPDDVISTINYIKNENKRTFFNKWAIIGSDIGASTAICASNALSYKPSTIVMLSPVINAKGIYIPVKLAELNVDILSITGSNDLNGEKANEYLKRFAQATYAEYHSSSVANGMLMLKNDQSLNKVIVAWINEYFK